MQMERGGPEASGQGDRVRSSFRRLDRVRATDEEKVVLERKKLNLEKGTGFLLRQKEGHGN